MHFLMQQDIFVSWPVTHLERCSGRTKLIMDFSPFGSIFKCFCGYWDRCQLRETPASKWSEASWAEDPQEEQHTEHFLQSISYEALQQPEKEKSTNWKDLRASTKLLAQSCEGWKESTTSAKLEFHIPEEHRDVKSPHFGLCSDTTSLWRKSVRKQFKSTDEQNVGVK